MTTLAQVVLEKEQLGEEADADVTEWLVADGAVVDAGQVIMLLESSKVVLEISSPIAGRVKFVASVGSVVMASALLATIEDV